MTDYPTTYEEAERIFKTARNPDAGKPVARNTRLFYHSDDHIPAYSIKLHDTHIVTFYANGEINLYHQGWTTPVTGERMNRALHQSGASWDDQVRVSGRYKSGWTHEVIRGFPRNGRTHDRDPYMAVHASNGSYIIPDRGGITLNGAYEVIAPEQYETLAHHQLMEAEESRERRRQWREEDNEAEIERFLNSPYACVFTPWKKPLACVFPRTSEEFVPSLVLVDARSRSKFKDEMLIQASLNGNRIDIVDPTVLREAIGYIQTN